MFTQNSDNLDGAQPHTPVKNSSAAAMSVPALVSRHDFDSATSSNLPPDVPFSRAPTALASPFHPGTTLGSSSNTKVDRFQDVRNLFAKRHLQKQDSGVGVEMGMRKCLCEKELEDEDDIYCSSGKHCDTIIHFEFYAQTTISFSW